MNHKKRILSSVLIFGVLSAGMISCKNEKKEENEPQEINTTQNGTQYIVDSTASKIEWKGYKVLKSENTSHFGTITFDEGAFTIKDGKLESGKFIADMTSLASVDLEENAEMKGKLEGHLKSADFFEVEKHPTATYEITKVSPTTDGGDYNTLLDGNLTIKGITKPVQFKANVATTENDVTIATEPTDINREDFGVKFQSPVENGVIKNEVTLQVNLKGNKGA